MASITIRRLEEPVKARLRARAARNGRSMEEEARCILKAGLAQKPAREENLYEALRRIVEPIGGIELEIPPREFPRPVPDFR